MMGESDSTWTGWVYDKEEQSRMWEEQKRVMERYILFGVNQQERELGLKSIQYTENPAELFTKDWE